MDGDKQTESVDEIFRSWMDCCGGQEGGGLVNQSQKHAE